MLINLCGAPCSGKSTLAKRFVAKYPEFALISIDDLRLETEDELEAWYLMSKQATAAQHCIVESSGLSIKLAGYILSDLKLQTRGIQTVILHAPDEILLERLKQRRDQCEKEEIPFIYENLSEEGLIKRFETLVEQRYPVAWHITTTDKDEEATYQELETFILKTKREIERATS